MACPPGATSSSHNMLGVFCHICHADSKSPHLTGLPVVAHMGYFYRCSCPIFAPDYLKVWGTLGVVIKCVTLHPRKIFRCLFPCLLLYGDQRPLHENLLKNPFNRFHHGTQQTISRLKIMYVGGTPVLVVSDFIVQVITTRTCDQPEMIRVPVLPLIFRDANSLPLNSHLLPAGSK